MKLVGGVHGLINVAASRPCVICGSAPVYVGAYFAEGEAARRLGAAAGKTRVVFYSLCDDHPPSPDVAAEAERLLEAFCAADPPLVLPADVVWGRP